MSSLDREKMLKMNKNKDKQPVQYFILKAVSIGRRMKVGEVIQQIEETISKKDYNIKRKVKPAYTIQRTIKKLESDGCLAIEIEESFEYIKLTEDGVKKLHDQMLVSRDSVVPLSSWNGIYIIVVLTTKDKNVREKLRYALSRAQFEIIAPGVFMTKLALDHVVIQLKEFSPNGFIAFKTDKLL